MSGMLDQDIVTLVSILAAITVVAYLLYLLLLPKPLPGIPYNNSSSRHPLGDLLALYSHISRTDGNLITFFSSTLESLNTPLAQIFIKPLGKPVLILSDFREAHSLLVTRKEFDRSPALCDLLSGLVPDHHIHLKTDKQWRAQRRLVQHLMIPLYLNGVAGPAIYETVRGLVALWRAKTEVANGRPWTASEDVQTFSLDAMMAFAFGSSSGKPAIISELVTVKSTGAARDVSADDPKEPIVFPKLQLGDVRQAMLDLAKTVMDLHGSLSPTLHWAYLNRKPRIKRARSTKEKYITQVLRDRLQVSDHTVDKSPPVTRAVDQMIIRERLEARREGRKPCFFSRVMIDELFGFIFAGNETTSTTISWGFKFLTSYPSKQRKLRSALREALSSAKFNDRDPTLDEIVQARIPYLDAVMEEILRCAGTSPFVDRITTTDTRILGKSVPRGTTVICLVRGPGLLSPSIQIDERLRYYNGSDGTSSTIGRGDRVWDSGNIAEFEPERWLVRHRNRHLNIQDDDESVEFDPAAGPQLAFGLGPRGCFGRRLVYLELRILLSLIVWNFELLECPEKLSSFKSVLKATNEPRQFYLRLCENNSASKNSM